MTYTIDYNKGTIQVNYTDKAYAIISFEAMKAKRKHPLVEGLPKGLVRAILEDESK